MGRREEQKRCIILSKLQNIIPLGANHFTYEGPGLEHFEKKSCSLVLSKEKKVGEKRKKIIATRKSSTPTPPPPKKSNGSPLTVENLFV